MSILDTDIAEQIADALTSAGLPLDVTLVRTTPGTPDPETPWIPAPPVVTNHACKGWRDRFSNEYEASSSILAGDVRIFILATTLDVTPQPGDVVTVRGDSRTIISVSTDPAASCWDMQAR